MIVSFPSSCMRFEVIRPIDKGDYARPAHLVSVILEIKAPIDIHAGDMLLIDLRTQKVEIVERDGFVIFRSGWLN